MSPNKLLRHPRVRRLFPKRLRGRLDTRARKEIVIDVAGVCNLRCPSCPVGNTGYVSPRRLIDVELFTRLIDKATADYRVNRISLYNWGEPFLHPELPELIRIARSRHLKVQLSSNLNLLRSIDAVLAARPARLRISLSGFTQEVYGQTHVRGDVERVKKNMIELNAAMARIANCKTRVEVLFHKYRHNLHEVEPMRAFAEGLGFSFDAGWAYYMPYENAADLAEGKLSEEKQRFVDEKFALPIHAAIETARQFRDRPCRLLEEQIALDLDGNVLPCCTIFDLGAHSLGSFLEMTPADFERARSDMPACKRCVKHGLHKYFTFYEDPELAARYEELVRENLTTDTTKELRKRGVAVMST